MVSVYLNKILYIAKKVFVFNNKNKINEQGSVHFSVLSKPPIKSKWNFGEKNDSHSRMLSIKLTCFYFILFIFQIKQVQLTVCITCCTWNSKSQGIELMHTEMTMTFMVNVPRSTVKKFKRTKDGHYLCCVWLNTLNGQYCLFCFNSCYYYVLHSIILTKPHAHVAFVCFYFNTEYRMFQKSFKSLQICTVSFHLKFPFIALL